MIVCWDLQVSSLNIQAARKLGRVKLKTPSHLYQGFWRWEVGGGRSAFRVNMFRSSCWLVKKEVYEKKAQGKEKKEREIWKRPPLHLRSNRNKVQHNISETAEGSSNSSWEKSLQAKASLPPLSEWWNNEKIHEKLTLPSPLAGRVGSRHSKSSLTPHPGWSQRKGQGWGRVFVSRLCLWRKLHPGEQWDEQILNVSEKK